MIKKFHQPNVAGSAVIGAYNWCQAPNRGGRQHMDVAIFVLERQSDPPNDHNEVMENQNDETLEKIRLTPG